MAYRGMVSDENSDLCTTINPGPTLQHVDVVELQAFQAELDRVKDVLPALAVLVDIATVVAVLATPKALRRVTRYSKMKLRK
jgi:hypothetical protein